MTINAVVFGLLLSVFMAPAQAETVECHWLVEPILAEARKLAQAHALNKTAPKPIIAIAGCSAVGKSHFARELAKLLKQEGIKVALLPMDDFIQPERVEYTTFHPYFDYKRLHEVLQQILAGNEHVQKPVWDKTGPKSVKEEAVACFHDIDLIIFEGLYTLTERDTYDFLKYSSSRVFISAPEDLTVEWNWQRELQKKNVRPKEKFDSDVAWDMEDYRKVVAPTIANADFTLYKDSQHEYTGLGSNDTSIRELRQLVAQLQCRVAQLNEDNMEYHDKSIKELQTLVTQFVDERGWGKNQTPKNMSMYLSLEAAELMEIFVWCESSLSTRTLEENREHVKQELADVFYWLLNFAARNNINLSQALEEKLQLNAKKYPVDKVLPAKV